LIAKSASYHADPCPDIVAAIAAPLIATAPCTVKSRRNLAGATLVNSAVSTYPMSGPPTQSAQNVYDTRCLPGGARCLPSDAEAAKMTCGNPAPFLRRPYSHKVVRSRG